MYAGRSGISFHRVEEELVKGLLIAYHNNISKKRNTRVDFIIYDLSAN